ncbi:MAG: CocE/NonD family hydrolase [Acidobacteria bacterium]|nr:CocE/NonD family hydrolase [Acidobacteriota bacterium]
MKQLRMFLIFAVPMFVFAAARVLAATPSAQVEQGQGIQTGVFYLVEGLSYRTQTLNGITNSKGEFRYRPGETVTFSIGDMVIGSNPGAKRLSSNNLVFGTNGDFGEKYGKKLKKPMATNLARFVQSLDEDNNVENGITISAQTREVVSQYNRKISFAVSETAFTEPNLNALFTRLNKTLRTGAQARNYERWTLLGVQAASYVKIPMRDGNYVMAYIYRPIDDGKYPAIVTIGTYGMSTYRRCACNPKEQMDKDAELDAFFEGNYADLPSERFEIADAWYWVPKGYAIIHIDGRGVCHTPGVLSNYGVQEQEDFYDSIEWAGVQPWSNGNIGTYGASMYGINQIAVASLQPPHLKAMLSIVGDVSHYRDIVYAGGILNTAQHRGNSSKTTGWYFNSVKYNRCLGQKTYEDTYSDKETYWLAHPFNEAPWYGTHDIASKDKKYDVNPPLEVDADIGKVIAPIRVVQAIEHANHQHTKGMFEVYLGAASKDKQLMMVNGNDIDGWMFTSLALEGPNGDIAWFDHWLKGIDNGVEKGPKFRFMVRTGDMGWYWRNESDYPVPNTEYRKYYLDAGPSSWAGDGKRNDFMKLSTTAPAAKASKSYSADYTSYVLAPGLVKPGGAQPCWAPGVSFVTEPLTADVVLAGFIKLQLWVSSSSSDMDIFASVRAMDKNNEEIPYGLLPRGGYYPIGIGWQKVSHRVLDKAKSTIYRSWTTDKSADYAPLKSPNDIVQVDVTIEPATAHFHQGDRIRLDVQPVDGCDFGSPQGFPYAYDSEYHRGATNVIHTGPDHPSYLQLPVLPPKGAQTSAVSAR